ncbi:MAG: hypothetical protein IPP91_03150 [Betaproteobacteria bacterium]|nr:hypothetical protein [Betaproteobacteria bacterium]
MSGEKTQETNINEASDEWVKEIPAPKGHGSGFVIGFPKEQRESEKPLEDSAGS